MTRMFISRPVKQATTDKTALLIYQINQVVKDILKETGKAVGNLSVEAGSKVVFEFHNVPPITLSLNEGHIWLQTPLIWRDELHFAKSAGALLEVLQYPLPWVVTDQPVLGLRGRELRALVDESCFVIDTRFGELLDAFYLRSCRLQQCAGEYSRP
ncbi:hypothetical protein GA565_15985 [Rouxiella sp. S1S-2]|uniref:hypothetical protein n=1 Tax=Rouxiella sp. S1S-2 TaxID=2653856 RepID=UPI001263EF57|nr:hypothetical protein [Rouxiella sp. S1S-2]KAB7897367.1 hypothetical protein GA565_15985 [Rouxiella sp. S1S-2]